MVYSHLIRQILRHEGLTKKEHKKWQTKKAYWNWKNDFSHLFQHIFSETSICISITIQIVSCGRLYARRRAVLPSQESIKIQGRSCTILCCRNLTRSTIPPWKSHYLPRPQTREHSTWWKWAHQTDWFWTLQDYARGRWNCIQFMWDTRIPCPRNSYY